MDFDYTEEQQMMRNMVRDFAEKEIIPRARDDDHNERVSPVILEKMGTLGFFGSVVPTEYGGMGIEFVSYAILLEELGRAHASVCSTVGAHTSLHTRCLLRWGNEQQKIKYLPRLAKGEILGCFGLTEPNTGSDVSGIETKGVLDKGKWVLNGNKMWISNAGICGLAVIFGKVEKGKGQWKLTAFLVERGTPGFTPKDIHGKLGFRASNTAEISLEDCRIPEENVLSEAGQGMKVALDALEQDRLAVAARSVGMAQGCIDASLSYAQTRYQFGKPIASFQLVQELLANMIIDTDAARFLVYRLAHLMNKGEPCTKEASIAKYFASEAAMRAATNAIQVHGAYGYSDEYPVERHFRDAKMNTIGAGASQIQQLIIGRIVTGINAFV